MREGAHSEYRGETLQCVVRTAVPSLLHPFLFPLQCDNNNTRCEIDAAPLVFEQLRDFSHCYLSYHKLIGFVVINQFLVFVLCFSQEIH